MLRACHVFLALLGLLAADPAAALPTMIRLGYSDCAACHLSPQGGGLLTPYGKGVDAAQSWRGGELEDASGAAGRLWFDVRTVAGTAVVDSNSGSPDMSSTFRATSRNAIQITSKLRTSFTVGLDSPTVTRAMRSGRAGEWTHVAVGKALLEFRPRNGV